ncbi:MAG: hypothetical protein ABR509_05685 [Candidatus Limnocylindria bacterium]
MASEDISSREPDPLAERLRSGDALKADLPQLPGPTVMGFFTRGDDDLLRLYVYAGTYIEFKADAVYDWAEVPPERSPVLGEKATAIRFKPEARVSYKREESGEHFDLGLHVYDVPAEELESIEFAVLLKTTVSNFGSCQKTKRTCTH